MTALRSIALVALFAVTGCGSIAKGVAEAVLEQSEKEDTRACHIDGPATLGMQAMLQRQEADRAAGNQHRELKVLMVHGIGQHIPGYSGRLTEHLMGALGLDLRQEKSKEFTLRNPDVWDGPLGRLRATRYMNKARTRELIFYELTWSEITEGEKKAIEFDSSKEYTFRRATLNGFMKSFINSHIPDPLIYLGEAHRPILASVQQSVCWMTVGDWSALPDSADKACDLFHPGRLQVFQDDELVFITHSLGSRIVIDMIQAVGDWALKQESPEFIQMNRVMREKQLRIYMMANQLPLLELGRKPAAVRGQIPEHCSPEGSLTDQRLLGETSIYAFSDPNDILSYPIPPKFADDYMDSRFCPRITNITINVAKPVNLFGISEVANPLEAHGGYEADDRVIEMMAYGIGHEGQSDLVTERCTWQETIAE